MKDFVKKYSIPLLLGLLGIIGGYLYWKYVGCTSGSCSITARWHTTVLFGGIIGYLLGDSIKDLLEKRSKKMQ